MTFLNNKLQPILHVFSNCDTLENCMKFTLTPLPSAEYGLFYRINRQEIVEKESEKNCLTYISSYGL